MREIKFRGFTINEEKFDNGKDGWIYGNLSILDDGTVDIQDINDENWFKAVNPESVGQYTGLHDKNGKEIYEGDILQIDINTAYVKHNDKYGYFQLIPIEDYYFDSDVIGQALEYLESEVIGNIYDNKNLLGGKNGQD